jgi:hypothetical protein
LAAAVLLVAPLTAAASLPPGYQTLYLLPEANQTVTEAAGELAGLLERQYGSAPGIRRLPLMGAGPGIRIGPNPEVAAFDDNPLTDQIRIARTPDGLAITGSDNTATGFAVHRFAREFLGWRRYQPGELGLERIDSPPPPPPVDGPGETLLLETATWHSRNPAMGGDPEARHWGRWQGLRERFTYSHTLHRALPPSVFDIHPDWFARDARGRPMRPPYYPDVHGYNDHPDLSHPAVREHAVRSAIQVLASETPLAPPADSPGPVPMNPFPVRQSPGIVSTSIGLGDSFVFGHFPESYPWRPEGYFRRWPDWSNHVFAYSNAVAEGLATAWKTLPWQAPGPRPDLYLGVLAYLTWENVPDFPIHSSLVPYLTYDRSQWHDPAARADDLANVAAWNRTRAPFLGTWDYLFGYGFLIPRSLSTIVTDSIPSLHQRGVRAYYSQVLPLWPFDGHTNWLTAHLLWNSATDPEALLNEYFHEFHGPAAPAMRRFFEAAESIWMNQEGRGWWLRYWKDPWQAALWDPESLRQQDAALREARRLAEAALPAKEADGLPADRFVRRIEQTRDLFSLTRAFLHYQWKVWEIQGQDWESAGPAALEEGLEAAREALRLRKALLDNHARALAGGPLTRNVRDLDWVFRYDALGAALAAIGARAGQLRPEGLRIYGRLNPLLSAWTRIHDLHPPPEIGPPGPEILHDNRFAEVENPRIWYRQFMDSENLSQSRSPRLDGYTVVNARRGHLYQLFKADPGNAYLGLLEVDTSQSPSGEVYIRIDFFDDENRLIQQSPRSRIAPVSLHGPRQRLRAVATAPPEAVHGRLFIRFYELDPDTPATVREPRVIQLPAR